MTPTDLDRQRLRHLCSSYAESVGMAHRDGPLADALQQIVDEITACMRDEGMEPAEAAREIARRRGVRVPFATF